MDLGLSMEQETLGQSARRFVAQEQPLSALRGLIARGDAFDPELHQRMRDLGWFGLLVAPEHGGIGLGWQETVVLYQEFGYGLLRTWHWPHAILAPMLGRVVGGWPVGDRLLNSPADGSSIVTVALRDPDQWDDLAATTTTLRPEGDRFRLSGTKLLVPAAGVASTLLITARLGGELRLVALPTDRDGLMVESMPTIDGSLYGVVRLNDVAVDADEISEPIGADALRDAEEQANLAIAAELVGVSERSLELATTYANQRVAFGQHIGAFQAIKHKLADVRVGIEGARVAVAFAAWLSDLGAPATAERCLAQQHARRAARRAVTESVQVFGGVGLMDDADISLYYRRAKMLSMTLPSEAALNDRIAGVIIDRAVSDPTHVNRR